MLFIACFNHLLLLFAEFHMIIWLLCVFPICICLRAIHWQYIAMYCNVHCKSFNANLGILLLETNLQYYCNTLLIISALYYKWHSKTICRFLKQYKYLDFLKQLIEELAKEELQKINGTKNANPNSTSTNTIKKLKQWSSYQGRLQGAHYPVRIKCNESKKMTKDENFLRGHCMICNKVIRSRCIECNIYLCIDTNDMNSPTCFKKFHTFEKLV